MAIRNKDGTVYRLSAPNPVMNTQELWKEYQIHNMEWDTEKIEEVEFIQKNDEPQYQDDFISNLDKAKEEINEKEEIKPKEEIKAKEEKFDYISEGESKVEGFSRKSIIKPDPKDDDEEQDVIKKVFIHCLPAKIRERKDSLYGDSYKTVQYDAPTSFEGVVLRQEDLFIDVWVDFDGIGIGSILYPKENFKRWWRVQEKMKKAGGWILTAVPSSFQPSFEL